MRKLAPAKLEGVVAEAATPRRAQEYSIDLGATLELIDFLGASGVSAILLLGRAGEFVHFALEDRLHMVNFAVKRSRVPVFVNVSHSTLDGAVELAREAAMAGVTGFTLMPPYYYRYTEDTIYSFFLTFARELGKAAPIYLSGVETSTARQLLRTELFAGVISSTLDEIHSLAGETAQVLAGCELVYRNAKEFGATGVVSGIASAVPELMVAFDRALSMGQSDSAARLEARIQEFLHRADQLPFAVAVKEAASRRKLKMGAFAVPPGEQEGRKLEEFREWLDVWLPNVLSECRA